MKYQILTTIAAAILASVLLLPTSCVKEEFDVVPDFVDTSSWKKIVTIAQVKQLYFSANNPNRVAGMIKKFATAEFWNALISAGVTDSSIIFQGYVTSNDSAGNFYEVVTLQDETGGIEVKINDKMLYSNYRLKPGQKVLVKVNNLALDFYRGVYQVGAPYLDAGAIKITGIEMGVLPRYVQRSGKRTKVQPVELEISQILPEHVQKLVTLKNVQFWDATKGYSQPAITTNRTLVDCSNNRIILRTSGYAKFKEEIVPAGNGSITGYLGIYDNTLQLYIRDLDDVQLANTRCGSNIPSVNRTIAEFKALCTSNLLQITQDVVVSGVVNANDESGNLFKQLFIEDNTGGIEFKIDIAGLYAEFPVGTRVAVNCNGLWIGRYGGVVQLGGNFNNSIGRLSADEFFRKVYAVESGIAVTPIVTTIKLVDDSMLGKLISISNIQFSDSELGKTWASSTTTTNRYVEDYSGNRLIVRTSNYANFATTTLPSGKGTIVGVLSKFNNDYQLYVRDLSDVRMIEPRDIKYYLINQDFSLATPNAPIAVGGWQSINVAGSKTWLAKDYLTTRYAEMSAYLSGDVSNVGWLISPRVNLTGLVDKILLFDSQYAYWTAGTTLEVFYSTDYNGFNPSGATWIPLTSAYIVQQSNGANSWVSSGAVSLELVTGNVNFGFKYTGSGTTSKTTSYRVDNVRVFSK